MKPGFQYAQIAKVALSFLLVVATLPPFNFGWAGLAILFPLLSALRFSGRLESAFYGACWGVLVGSYMYWGVAAYYTLVFGLTLAVVAAVSAALFLCTSCALKLPRAFVPFLIAALWALSELLLNTLGIPYSLSVLLADITVLIQPLKIGGQHFLAGLVYMFQTAIFLRLVNKEAFHAPLIASIVLPVGVLIAAQFVAVAEPLRSLKVSAVQTNSHPYSYVYRAADGVLEASIVQRKRLQTQIASDSELVVWPEWAVLGYQFRLPNAYLQTGSAIQLVNAQDLDPAGERRNLVAAIDAQGQFLSVSGKTQLIPFIEQSVTAAEQSTLHSIAPGRPLSTICYESVFPALTSRLVLEGAHLVTILTSDAFAGPSLIPLLHSRYAMLRAVENNRFAVRAANAGVSMVVSNRGEVIRSLPLFDSGVINTTVNEFGNITPYTRYARFWWWTILLSGLSAVVAVSVVTPVNAAAASVRALKRRDILVGTMATVTLATAGVLLQGVYISHLLASTNPEVEEKIRYPLFFANAYDVENYTYRQTQSGEPAGSLQSALAYVLRTYGLPTDQLGVSELYKLNAGLQDDAFEVIEPVVKQFGFSLKLQDIDLDTLTMPVIAVMNSGEAVVVEDMDDDTVAVFSPVNGPVKLDTQYFYERLATRQVMFLVPPKRSWDGQ